ncbi:MAG: thiamine-phosphate synthase family protein [Promethearchaeota archaeon]
MRFPCEKVVKEFLTEFRFGLIQSLHGAGWTQQRIADSLNLTQAAVSNYLKRGRNTGRKIDPEFQVLVEHVSTALSTSKMNLASVMEAVCYHCKEKRFPGNSFCTQHMQDIPELAELKCDICSKYLNRGMFTAGESRGKVLGDLVDGFEKLKNNIKFIKLIPEVQSNLVLGLENPLSNGVNDYAAFPGRLIKLESEVRIAGMPEFGASKHIATIISIVREFHTRTRCATCIAYNKEIHDVLMKLDFNTIILDNERDLDLFRDALKKELNNEIDAVVFKGSFGFEPVTYILSDSIAGLIRSIEKICFEMED